MMFDKNQTEFKDCIQEKVWELATRQVPLEVTLPYVETLKSACTDWYNFNQNLFADMYENPERFGFEIDPSKPDWMNKKQVEFYHWLIGGLKNFTSNQYEMPANTFKELIKKFNPKSVEALKAHGFVFEEIGTFVAIYNDIYPDMFVGIQACDGRHYKVNGDYFMMYCDFRASAGYKRTYADLHLTLSDENRKVAEKIHGYNISQKVMPQKCNYFFRVEYKHKGKIVYIADLQPKNQFKINIGFANIGGEAFKLIEQEIEKYDDADEFKQFLLKHCAKKCNGCKSDCYTKSNPTKVFGKRMVICGNILFVRIYDPEERDLKHIFRVIELRTMVIKEGLSEAFYPGNG